MDGCRSLQLSSSCGPLRNAPAKSPPGFETIGRSLLSGACHVLAFRLVERSQDQDLDVVLISPTDGVPGSHVYVSDGQRAFDFNGWTNERFFLEETARRCRARWPGWECELIRIVGSLQEFCFEYRHRLPAAFAFDPIPRADRYLERVQCDDSGEARR